jgi:hypothetical protein
MAALLSPEHHAYKRGVLKSHALMLCRQAGCLIANFFNDMKLFNDVLNSLHIADGCVLSPRLKAVETFFLISRPRIASYKTRLEIPTRVAVQISKDPEAEEVVICACAIWLRLWHPGGTILPEASSYVLGDSFQRCPDVMLLHLHVAPGSETTAYCADFTLMLLVEYSQQYRSLILSGVC